MWLDRPNFEEDDLIDWYGYVTELWVEQEDERDQIFFTLQTELFFGFVLVKEYTFCIYLDVGTTVALAQLQLLRDALEHDYLVRVHTNNADSDTLPSETSNNYVYWLKVYKLDYHVYYGDSSL